MANRQEMSLKVVRVTSQMTTEYALELRNKLTTLLTRPDMPDVVFDLSDVRAVDAAGVGALTAAYTSGLTYGHSMFIYNPSSELKTLLAQLDLEGFFPLIKSESELLSRVRDITRMPE